MAQSKHPKSRQKKKKKKGEKRIVWVAGYKEEVSGDTKTNSSHKGGDVVDHAGMWIGLDSIEGEAQ